MSKQKKTKTQVEIEKLNKRLIELRQRQSEISSEIEQLKQQHGTSDTQARKLLDKGKIDVSICESLERLHEERRLIERALNIGEKELRQLQSDRATEIAEQARPEAQKLARQMFRTLSDFQESVGKWHAFLDGLDRQGCQHGQRPAEMSREHNFFRYFHGAHGIDDKSLQSNVFMEWLGNNWL